MEQKQTKQTIQSSERDWKQFFKYYDIKKEPQQRFLKAYSARLLNISTACEIAGVGRSTVYDWMNNSDTFKKAKESLDEDFYDKLETTIYAKALSEQDNTMLIFLAKTKMKHRGYIERVEQQVTQNPFMELMKTATCDDEDDE